MRDRSYTIGTDYVDNKTTNIIILNNNNNNINNHHHTYSGGKTSSSVLISSSVFLDTVNDDDAHMTTTKTIGVTVNGQSVHDDGSKQSKEDRNGRSKALVNGDGKKKYVSKTCITEPVEEENVVLGRRSSVDSEAPGPNDGGHTLASKNEPATVTVKRNGSLKAKDEGVSKSLSSSAVNGSSIQRKPKAPSSKVAAVNGKRSSSKEKLASLNGKFSASKEKLSAIGGKLSASREKLTSINGKRSSSKEKITAVNGKSLTSTKDDTSLALKEDELNRVVGTRLSSVSSNYSTTSSSTTSSKNFSSKDSPRLASTSSTDSRSSGSSKQLSNSKEKLSSTRGSCQSLTSQLRIQYPDVSGVAEKLSNLFCRRRTHTYHVQRRQKGLSLPPSFAETTGNWVTVANLRQLDGGILDPDDRLCDVVDDRDQIIAVYTEHPPLRGAAPYTDTAASSAAPSRSHTPDIFQESEQQQYSTFNRTDIEVTGEELNNTPPPLHVRRGSEPTLNRLSPIPPTDVAVSRGEGAAPSSHTVVGALKSSALNKRWSAAPVIDDDAVSPPSSTPLKDHDALHPNGRSFVYPGEERGEGSGEEKNPSSSASSSASSHHSATNTAFSRFARDTNRCSIQVLSDNPAMSRWADAAERIGGSGMSYNEMRRRDPVGGASTSPHHSRQPSLDARHGKMHDLTPRTPFDNSTAATYGGANPQKMYDVNGKEFVYGQQHHNTNDYQNLQGQHYGHARTQSTDTTVANVGGRSLSHDRQFDGQPFAHHERSHSHDSYAVDRQQQPQYSTDPYRQGFTDINSSNPQPRPGVPGTPQELDASRSSQDGGVYGSSPLKYNNNDRSRESTREERVLVVLNNGCGPLGIHVIPSPLMGRGGGNEGGLLVEGVEDGGRVAQDGRIQVHDRIVDINGHSLLNTTFHQAQEIFKDAMQAPALRLLVAKARSNSRRTASTNQSINLASSSGPVAGAAPHPLTKQPPPTSLSARTQTVMLQSSSRRPGRHITLCLTKGQHGLGFSITTRDNPARGHAPIYIKSILPKGAAIEDGSLRIGDKLVSVNGKEVTGLGQTEVANMLRKVPVGGRAILEVSRQERGVETNTAPIAGGATAAKVAGPAGDSSAPQDGVRDRLKEDHPPSPQLPRQLGVEKAWEDSLMFPWKQREIITLDIPIHDSERAGLGVSVKGKTSSGSSGGSGGPVDLGIFVKNVIFGGAASRDGRLMENDQLVNINGLSLLGKPNSEAMNTLRVAMHQEGPVPGMITLTIARRVGTTPGSQGGDGGPHSLQGNNSFPRSGRDSANSGASNSTGTETLGFLGGARTAPTTPTPYEGVVTDNNVTAHFNVTCSTPSGDPMTSMHHNPVLHRLTGNTAALRNDSYYQATHDTWNNSEMAAMPSTPASRAASGGGREACVGSEGATLGSPTVNLPSRDTLIIQDEYGPVHDGGSSQLGGGGNNSCLDDTYNSQTSLDAAGGGPAGFSRDQFGRQSMSEKRHATLDAKSTDTYQRNKKAREDRERMRQQMQAEEQRGVQGTGRHTPPDLGPGLGMKKSSSLESLQTMVQEMTLSECGSSSRGGGSSRGGSGRVPRGRGCNESFRAAVDRSYDAPLAATEAALMDTLAEEEAADGRPSLPPFGSDGGSKTLGHKTANNSKKNKGLLKGLGSMFRFGKHRKTLDNNIMTLPDASDSDNPSEQAHQQALQQQQQQMTQQQQMPQYQQYDGQDSSYDTQQEGGISEYPVGGGAVSEDPDSEGGCSRAERMHQLRAQHQRRHAQRNRTYPSDGAEEQYDERGAKRLEPVPSPADSQPLRSPPDEYGLPPHRPGSRGVRGAMHPPAEANSKQYAHYANYQQIKQHLRSSSEQERLKQLASQQYRDFREKHHNSRDCREYQSQRGPREGTNHSQSRPVSNYYEYESVQAIMTHASSGYGGASNAVAGGGGRLEAPAPAALHNSSGAASNVGLTPPHYQHHQHNNTVSNSSSSNRRGAHSSGVVINNTAPPTNNYTSNSTNNNSAAGGSSTASSNINNSAGSSNNNRNNSNVNKIVSNLNYNTSSSNSNNNPLSLSVHTSGNSRTIGYGPNTLLPDMTNTGLHNSLPRRAHLHQHFADNLPIVTGTNMRQQHNASSNSKHSPKPQQQQYPPPGAAPFTLHKTQMMQAAAAFHAKSGSSSSNNSSQKGGSLYPPQPHSRHPPPPPPHSHAPTHRQQQHGGLRGPHLGGAAPQQVPGSKV